MILLTSYVTYTTRERRHQPQRQHLVPIRLTPAKVTAATVNALYMMSTGSRLEVCMGLGNPMGIPFPWESHGNGNSHTAHDGNGNGNKANGNGNRIYFTRVKIPKIIVMH